MGINDKAKELITDPSAGFTFKIVLEDENGIHYSFDALMPGTKAADNGINKNPNDANLYFPHHHTVEFLNEKLNPEWKYNKREDKLLDAVITDGQPSMKKIVERATNGQSSPDIVQTVEIQLYNQPGLFEGSWGNYYYATSTEN